MNIDIRPLGAGFPCEFMSGEQLFSLNFDGEHDAEWRIFETPPIDACALHIHDALLMVKDRILSKPFACNDTDDPLTCACGSVLKEASFLRGHQMGMAILHAGLMEQARPLTKEPA